MSNAEVFRNYFSEDWVIEENLCYLLHEYDEARKETPRINKVGFVKNFLKMNTYVDVDVAEKSRMETMEETAINVEAVEV